jgi:hypothetical protein
MSATDDVLTNAEAFAASFAGRELPAAPARKLAIVTSTDARLNPQALFGLGDASSLYVARRLSNGARGAFIAAADSGTTVICDAYGGAINRVDPTATAFVHRRARFSVQLLSYAPNARARTRVRHARTLIAPGGDGEAYQNYSDRDLPDPLTAYYGANLARLVSVKTQVDPEDRFHITQGIEPAHL